MTELTRLLRDDRLIIIILLSICVAYTMLNASLTMSIDMWRHDALIYLSSYEEKLATEGRWINYFIFPFASSINPSLAWLINIMIFGVFFYVIFIRYLHSRLEAATFSIFCLTLSPLNAQLMWPATAILGPFVLLIYSIFVNEKNIFLLNIITGILLFGIFNSYIFFLPLVWLSLASARSATCILKWAASWLAGFIAGYAVSNLVTRLITGSFIAIAGWRNPNPLDSMADLVINSQRAMRQLGDHFSTIFGSIPPTIFLAIFLWMFVLLYRSDKQEAKKLIFAVPLVLLAALSVYAQAVALGIYVSFRTSIELAVAGVVMIAVVYRPAPATIRKVIALALLLPLLITNGNNSINIKNYFLETQAVLAGVREKLESINGIYFSAYRNIYVFNKNNHSWDLHEYIRARPPRGLETLSGEAMRWGRGLLERRGQDLVQCEGPKEKRWGGCERFEDLTGQADCNNPYLGFCQEAVSVGNSLILFTRQN